MAQRGIKLWQFVDSTERDATGSNDGLQVNDVANLEGGALFICATVAASTSTWTEIGATSLNALDWKESVRAASTANGTLASDFEAGDTLDGVTLVAGDRILLKNQSTASENGIYTVESSGAPTRAADADEDAEVTSGLTVAVEEGTANADTIWMLTTNGTITVGSTGLTFTQLNISTPALAPVLAVGNTTGGNDMVVSDGDAIVPATDGNPSLGGAALRWAAVFALTLGSPAAPTDVHASAVEFVQQSSNPGGTAANTLYQDDGSNFIAGTLWWGSDMVIDGEVSIGDPGTEQGSIAVQGGTYDASLKVNAFGGSFDASLILHRHSTTDSPEVVYARSNSDTSAHAVVTSGQVLGSSIFLGHDGTDYNFAAQMVVEVDGTPGANDMPGRFRFLVSPDGSNSPAEAMRISQDGSVSIPNGPLLLNGPSTGADATADDLVVGNNTADVGMTFHGQAAGQVRINFHNDTNPAHGAIRHALSTGTFTFRCANNDRWSMGGNLFAPTVAGFGDIGSTSLPVGEVHVQDGVYIAGAAPGDNPQVDGITVGDGSGSTEIGQFIDSAAGIGYFSVTDASGTRVGELSYAAANNTWSVVANGSARLQITTTLVQPGSDGSMILGNTLSRGFSGLALTERADHPNTPTASRCELWLRSDTHQTLILTDDEGNDHALNKWEIHLPAQTSEEPSGSAAALNEGMNGLGDRSYLDFDDAAYSDRIWQLRVPRSYAGGDITVRIFYFGAASNAGADEVIFYGSFEVFAAGNAMGTFGGAAAQSVTTTPNATAQKLVIADITFTSAQIDGAVAGDWVAFRLYRNPGVGNDDYANPVGVFGCLLLESA